MVKMDRDMVMLLVEMLKNDKDAVIKLIADAMNENEGRWAKETIGFHFFCKENGKDDGRVYYVAKSDDKIVGISGLHRYTWGPEDITWLGWFAVDPALQRKGIGYVMMEKTCQFAKKRGFRKIFIETYSDDTFSKGRAFYEKFGFKRAGGIKDYIKDGVDMVVYARDL